MYARIRLRYIYFFFLPDTRGTGFLCMPFLRNRTNRFTIRARVCVSAFSLLCHGGEWCVYDEIVVYAHESNRFGFFLFHLTSRQPPRHLYSRPENSIVFFQPYSASSADCYVSVLFFHRIVFFFFFYHSASRMT